MVIDILKILNWIFNYQITTPWKIIKSLSTVLNKKYIANIEIEQTDYSFIILF